MWKGGGRAHQRVLWEVRFDGGVIFFPIFCWVGDQIEWDRPYIGCE